eukprot:COSAG06_NODE_1481_length_9319_cov_264.596963_4_plen_73_part_00
MMSFLVSGFRLDRARRQRVRTAALIPFCQFPSYYPKPVLANDRHPMGVNTEKEKRKLVFIFFSFLFFSCRRW